MDSRDKILAAVMANQPASMGLPDLSIFDVDGRGSQEEFTSVLHAIGGKAVHVSGYEQISQMILKSHGENVRIISPVKQLQQFRHESLEHVTSARDLHDVEVAIIKARFGVAENGAVWVTEHEMHFRALPFITQHLAVILNADAIVPTMHKAYDLISSASYGFGTFIAGPSKTADIEQALVIGAHGPRSMTVFILQEQL